MKLRIEAGKLAGSVPVPPSKSCAHRLLIAQALAGIDIQAVRLPEGDDIAATAACLPLLGQSGAVFSCDASGSTLRFLIPPALALADEAVFTGTPRLLARGISLYEKVLPAHGVRVEQGPSGFHFTGRLQSGDYALPGNQSSQYVTGLLFALPLLPGDSFLRILPPVVSRPYIALTRQTLTRAGIEIVDLPGGALFIPGGQTYLPQEESVEGDWSAAAVLYAFNALGSDLTVTGLTENSLQGDRTVISYLEALKKPGAVIDLTDCPDLGPVLFAAAAALHGAVFTGVKRLQNKESDRVSRMAEELAGFGIRCLREEDRLTVFPGLAAPSEPLCSHDDHRLAMALTLLLSLTGGELRGAEAVSKSWPDFFRKLAEAGLQTEECD